MPLSIRPGPRGSLEALKAQPRDPLLTPDATPLNPTASLLPGQARIKVLAVGLNFRDVLNVLGMYPGDPGDPGSDCCGLVLGSGDQEFRCGFII